MQDVISDAVTDYCHRHNLGHVQQVFYQAAIDAGYEPAKALDRARWLFGIWAKDGYDALPEWVREFVLTKKEG
jgi:hypothetical protein